MADCAQAGEGLADSVDEILEQASESALKLVSLQESVERLRGAVGELRDEMLAGLVEVKKAGGGAGDAAVSQRLDLLTNRLEDLDGQIAKVAGGSRSQALA